MENKMEDVYVSRPASLHNINLLATWVRKHMTQVEEGKLDVIRFVEIDLPKIYPGLYLEIESDESMPRMGRAYVAEDRLSIVVSESIYEAASNGCLFSSEVILHEVGHLFLHKKYIQKGLNNGAGQYKRSIPYKEHYSSAEWQADMFALCFLYPLTQFNPNESDDSFFRRIGATKKQSERIRKHLYRLESRSRAGVSTREIKWLNEIVNEIKQIRASGCKPKQLQSKQQHQFA